ncbi:metal-dependent hydrolase [Candidatus Altiarchaeota archaeon]
MDPLTHLLLSLAGGYLLAYGLKLRLHRLTIPVLSLSSLAIDVDHVLPIFDVSKALIFHNLVAIAIFSAVLWLATGWKNGLVLLVMLFGHLVMDMNTGIYGIPLLYPLSSATYLIPESWEVRLMNESSLTVISRTGISLSLYMGFIAGIILAGRRMQAPPKERIPEDEHPD